MLWRTIAQGRGIGNSRLKDCTYKQGGQKWGDEPCRQLKEHSRQKEKGLKMESFLAFWVITKILKWLSFFCSTFFELLLICSSVEVWNLLTKAQNQQERLLIWPCTVKSTGDFFFQAKKKYDPGSRVYWDRQVNMILIYCEIMMEVCIGYLHIEALNQTGESFKLNFERYVP